MPMASPATAGPCCWSCRGWTPRARAESIEKVAGAVNPQGVAITSFKKPTEEELAHDFLWRINKALPPAGKIGVFDRSHYEDVLIVRVHKLQSEGEIERRYEAINEFEKPYVESGGTIIKCLLHVDKDIQKERLAARLEDPEKYYKYRPGDLDERAEWDAYTEAYQLVLDRCSTDVAPWHVVPSGHKPYRNWAVATLLLEALRDLKLDWPAAARFDSKPRRARRRALDDLHVGEQRVQIDQVDGADGVASQDDLGDLPVRAQRLGDGDGTGFLGQFRHPVGQEAGREEQQADGDVPTPVCPQRTDCFAGGRRSLGRERSDRRQLVPLAPLTRRARDGSVDDRVGRAGSGEHEAVEFAHPVAGERIHAAGGQGRGTRPARARGRSVSSMRTPSWRRFCRRDDGRDVDLRVVGLRKQQRDDNDLVVTLGDQAGDSLLERRLGEVEERGLDAEIGTHACDLLRQGFDGGDDRGSRLPCASVMSAGAVMMHPSFQGSCWL